MIYIIGTDHHLQFGCCNTFSSESLERFEQYLKFEIEHKNISLVVEEGTEDAKIYYCETVVKTISEKITEELNIKHIFCDPNDSERKRLGIRGRDYIAQQLKLEKLSSGKYSKNDEIRINGEAAPDDRRREKFWYKKINPLIKHNRDILVVCGFGHTTNFLKLIKNRGYNGEILQIFRL